MKERVYKTPTLAFRLKHGLRHRKMSSVLLDAKQALFEHVCLNCGFMFKEVLMGNEGGKRRPVNAVACLIYARVWNGYGASNGTCPMCSDPKSATARRIAAEKRKPK